MLLVSTENDQWLNVKFLWTLCFLVILVSVLEDSAYSQKNRWGFFVFRDVSLGKEIDIPT